MELYKVFALLLFHILGCVLADEVCFVDETNSWESCDKGCCGRSYEHNRRCCNDTDVLVWIIVGSVIGGIIVLTCIMAVVIYFCCIRGKTRQGMVVNPSPNTQITTLVYQVPGGHSQNSPYPLYGHGTAVNPPPYMGPPPTYTQGQTNQQPAPQTNPAPWTQQQYPPPTSQSTSTNQFNGQVPPPPKY